MTKTIKQYIAQLEREKDAAYRERNQVVAALSKIFPSFLALHDENDKSWDDEWRWIVYMTIPSSLYGNPIQDFPHQLSWHLHISDLPLFDHLQRRTGNHHWDGHDTEEKYRRLREIKKSWE